MAEKRKTKTSSAVKNRYNNRVYGSIIVRVPKEMAEVCRYFWFFPGNIL